ncbi:MAG TPA: phosphotransferase [Candidatus Limnocylindrales bacterium]|nr:phosphotransferase [Candidatus Limnocylindrales bacterium]
MTGEIPERDPLADLVSRSLGAWVASVEVEILAAPEGVERKRLRFDASSGVSTLIFERLPRGEMTQAQLLPFLARRSDRVPALRSRGLPPPHASLGPWILIEDVYTSTTACDDPIAILDAKRAIERAVANDLPALRALGLRDDARDLPPALAAAPRGLLHGDLRCENALRIDRGVVLVGWRNAHIGAAVLDAASLVLDLEQHDRATDAVAVRRAYGEAELFAEAERFVQRAPRRDTPEPG